MKLLAAVACAVLQVGCAVLPPTPPSPPRQTTLGLDISSFALPNGLRVVLVAEPRAAEVSVTMRYQVGAVDDPDGAAGMAHLVEHLLYVPLLARLQDATTYFNGATTLDATTFEARADAAHLDALLAIEADRLARRCGELGDTAFARERQVVVNEVRERAQSSGVLGALHAALYPAGHPYRRIVAGTEASVAAITREAACAFADAHYAPGNAVLVIAGNVTRDRVIQALSGTLARAENRAVAPPVAVVPVDAVLGAAPVRVQVAAPIERDAVVFAWPLSVDPRRRVKLRALVPALVRLIDGKVAGKVAPIEVGDARAPMIGFAVLPSGESIDKVIATVNGEIADLPYQLGMLDTRFALDSLVAAALQQGAIAREYGRLEDGGDRDTWLAGDVAAGFDPKHAIGLELGALGEMGHTDAASVARRELTVERASVIVMHPSPGAAAAGEVAFAAPIDDLGARGETVDLEAAHRPATDPPVATPAGARTRTLANGMRVVLLPLTTVPAVEIRVIVGAGTADEPDSHRGVAMVAANALGFDPHYLNDALVFAAAGGTISVDAGTDATTFTARGLDMHLDYLLSGMRRLVRDGIYEDSSRSILAAMRQAAKQVTDDGALTDRWRAAVFGAQHPYARAGLARYANPRLTLGDAATFRVLHYAPDNTTIVIAGRFDPAIADAWIDFLFATWTGRAEPPSHARARVEPASLARDDATAQIQLGIALPATAGTRAARLIAAEMLGEVATGVRMRFGASYGVSADLSELRLASHYVLSGAIDATRAADAIALLRDGLAALHTDPDAAARTFVVARERVLHRLAAVASSSTALAERAEQDTTLARPPLSDAATAGEVRALTIDGMGGVLDDLDLARAVISMRGPRAQVDRAYAELGRTPEYVRAPDRGAADDAAPGETVAPTSHDALPDDIAAPLTAKHLDRPYTLVVGAGYATGALRGHDVTGTTLGVGVGYRVTAETSVGVVASFGSLDGSYTEQFPTTSHDQSIVPLGLEGFVQLQFGRRAWAAGIAGALFDCVWIDDDSPSVDPSLAVGLEAGVDLLRKPGYGLGPFVRFDDVFISFTTYQALTFGVALRR